MKFQVTIPPLTEDDFQMNVTVEGANWRTALRAALKKIGESAELVKNIDCDVQDDGSFKITDIDTKRVFTIKEIAEAAGAADAQRQEEAKRAADEKRRQEEEAEKRRVQEAEEARRAELKREEERRRDEESRRAEEQRLLREQTVREEEQAAQRKAAAEAKRLEEEQQRQREEGQRKLEDEKRQRDEQKRREDAQRTALEEQRKKEDDAKKQREEEQRKKEAAQKAADEQKKRETAAKATETQKLSRPKSKGETIETRLGQKVGGTDTVEFLSDAFDALGELFSISSPQKAVEFILEQAIRKAPSDAGSVFFNDVGKRQVSFWAARGPKSEKLIGKSIPYGKGIVGYCISKSVSLAIPDVSQDPRWDPAVSESISFETRSVLCAPLYYEGRCYGAIELLNRKSDSGFTRRELSVVNYLAEQLARWLHENGD